MTLRHWLQTAAERLAAAGVDSPRLEAQVLAEHVLLVDRAWLFAHPEAEFPELAGETLLMRRLAHEPLAYLVGGREFYGRRFGVTPDVLIPRQETETLIEQALNLGPKGPAAVLDIGTGSGCIAVTLKLERPAWDVSAVDVSVRALAVAEENADVLGARVRLVESDGFAALLGEAFDLIVTNPPYIAEGEPLMPEVAEHEPAAALFSGPTGLEFYKRLAKEAPAHLNDGGLLLMEVGYTQAEPVRALFRRAGWEIVSSVCDMSGVERVVVARFAFGCSTD